MTVRTLPSAAQRALTELLPLSDARGWHRAACRGDPNHDAWFPYPSEDFDYGRALCAGVGRLRRMVTSAAPSWAARSTPA